MSILPNPVKRGSIRRHIRRVDNHVCGKVEFSMKSRSKNDGTTYSVVVDPSDGSFSCDCPAGEFRPNTQCAHVKRAFNLLERHGELAPVIANLNGQGANIHRGSQFVAPTHVDKIETRFDIVWIEATKYEAGHYAIVSTLAPARPTSDELWERDAELMEDLSAHDKHVFMIENLERRRCQIDALLQSTNVPFDSEVYNELSEINERLDECDQFGWPLPTGAWEFPHHYCKDGDYVIAC